MDRSAVLFLYYHYRYINENQKLLENKLPELGLTYIKTLSAVYFRRIVKFPKRCK